MFYSDIKVVKEDFFLHELKKAMSNGIIINISNGETVKLGNGIECSGYFNDNPKEFAVAVGKHYEDWFKIFVHESCHMDQFLENSDIWKLNIYCDIIDEWLSGKEFSDDVLDDAFYNVKELELDCEIRAVRKIINWDLNLISLTKYIKEANIYLLSYNFVRKYRKWVPQIYKNELLLKKSLPFLCSDHKTVDEPLAKIFDNIFHSY